MTFVSVADACRRLGIDAKTLHCWLAQAQLPLQAHPYDGRKKGLSEEHLQVLARLHQRRLTALPHEQEAPQALLLPAALLSLPDQLDGLQAQIAALQQQLADLSQRLPPPAPQPVSPAPSASPTRTSRGSSPPPPAAPRAAKPPRKPVHVIPRVEYGEQGHYVVISPKDGLLPFEPDSPAWFAWLAQQESFRFVGKEGHFTAHHWWRVPTGAWRAHRKIRNRSANLRLAPTPHLTIAVLEQAAAQLQAQVH